MKPCQDVSLAGRRAGMTEGTRSNLWGAMRTAIETIQPRYVVAENVRGLLSAKAASYSDVEPGPGFVGDDGRPNLRALGRVLGDLADLGFDAEWCGLRAADVGAPHGRFRVFILATRRDVAADPGGLGGVEAIEHHGRDSQALNGATVPHEPDRQPLWTGPHGEPAANTDRIGGNRRRIRAEQDRIGQPADGGDVAAHASGIGRRARGAESARFEGGADVALRGASTDWGKFTPAIRRWEQLHGRAPAPTELTAKGKHRLSAKFAEWMMGLPAGWVTDIDISRNEQLKALGNGVVPQQCYAALTHMLNTQRMENAA